MVQDTIEIWKDVVGYEGYYQVSDQGRVKSLTRMVRTKSNGYRVSAGRIISQKTDRYRYFCVGLYNNTVKHSTVHQLVAQSFLSHNPCGMKLVVNHKDANKKNNNIDNLEIITNRENLNRKHIKHTSIYTGVSWYKITNRWQSAIRINGKQKSLGYFKDEYQAHLAYENALKDILSIPNE